MSRPDIVFQKAQGAKSKVAAGEDYISGLLLYVDDVPTGFTADMPVYLSGLKAAEDLGIVADYSDATAAQAVVTFTAAGQTGSHAEIKVEQLAADYSGIESISLGSFVTTSATPTVTEVATGLKNAINALTKVHGYSATSNAGALTIIAPKRLGVSLNSASAITMVTSNDITVTLTTDFANGVGSLKAVWHYHIAEFFRANPAGRLWLMFSDSDANDYTEITTLQTAASGKIRQVGVFANKVYAAADMTLIQNIILTYNDAKHKPLSALYAANLKGTADITTIADLTTLNDYKVSSIIGQDGAYLGNYLFLVTGKSVTQLGIALGMLSYSAVSEDFGNPARFNLTDGNENDVPAFANGQKVADLSDNELDDLDAKRHIFPQKYVGFSGTFFNDNHCACSTTSDYAFINDNRVIDKACRGIYAALIPVLKGKILRNADGTLAATTIAYLESLAIEPLFSMARDGDLSEVANGDIYIDPSQNIVTTSKLVIEALLNENGIARRIEVPISFKA